MLATRQRDDGAKKAKGKGADIARWEAELRQSLASKRGKSGNAGGLSKEAHALVQAQLAKEGAVRERVAALRVRVVRALAFVRAAVSSGTGVRPYVRVLATLLLEGTMTTRCARLLGEQGPYETFVGLTGCCSERLDGLRKWVGVAMLRALETGCVPEAQAAEPLSCAFSFVFSGRVSDVFVWGSTGAAHSVQAANALGTSAI